MSLAKNYSNAVEFVKVI